MKVFFEGWRRYLREGETTMPDKASEKNMIGGQEAQQLDGNMWTI